VEKRLKEDEGQAQPPRRPKRQSNRVVRVNAVIVQLVAFQSTNLELTGDFLDDWEALAW